jgi:hypothetical protein
VLTICERKLRSTASAKSAISMPSTARALAESLLKPLYMAAK